MGITLTALVTAGCKAGADTAGADTAVADTAGAGTADTDDDVDETGAVTSKYECDQAGWPQVIVDGGPSFETIQDALVAAGDGADVLICDGTYEGPVVIERPVRVRTEKGPDFTRIQGGSPALQVRADGVYLSGLTLTGGEGLEWEGGGDTSTRAGGGLYAGSVRDLTIEDCVIGGNIADYGGGLAAVDVSGLTLRRVIVSENAAAVAGGGLYLQDSEASIEDSTLSTNGAGFGGGAAISGGSAHWSGASLEDNTAEADGGGVLAIEGAALTISGGAIRGNLAESGGGLRADASGAVQLDGGVLIADNTAAAWGGGLLASGAAALSLDHAVVQSNSADFGGGLFLWDLSANLVGVELLDNSADSGGGGIYGLTSTVNLEGGELSGSWLAEPDSDKDSPCGAGLLSQSSVFSIYEDALIAGNTSPAYGGGACLVGGDLVLDRAAMRDNSADFGGAIWLQDVSYALTSSAVVTGNQAASGGGGAFLHTSGAILLSSHSDWGSEADDNHPDDVSVWGVTYSQYAGDASFSCDVSLGQCN